MVLGQRSSSAMLGSHRRPARRRPARRRGARRCSPIMCGSRRSELSRHAQSAGPGAPLRPDGRETKADVRRCGGAGSEGAVRGTGLDDAAQPRSREARRRLDRDRIGAPEPRRDLLWRRAPATARRTETRRDPRTACRRDREHRSRSMPPPGRSRSDIRAAAGRRSGRDDRQVQPATVPSPRDRPPMAGSGLERVARPVVGRVREDRRRRGPDPRTRSNEWRAEGGVVHPHVLERADRSRSSLAPPRRPLHDPARARRRARRAAANQRGGLATRRARRRRRPWRSSQPTGASTPRRGRSGERHDGSRALHPRGAGPASLRHTCRARPPPSPAEGCWRHACGVPTACARARRRLSGGPRLRRCPRLDRATASPGYGHRRGRRRG